MLKKKDYVIAVAVIYLFMIMLYYIMMPKGTGVTTPCSYSEPCVRFCCDDSSLCKEKHIRENFNSSLLRPIDPEDQRNDTEEYIILHGEPQCGLMSISDGENWKFSYRGNIILEDVYYDSDEYCFKESFGGPANETVLWHLQVCKRDYYWQENLRIITSVLSTIFSLGIVAVYASTYELRTSVPGKCILILFSSFLAFYIAIPFYEIQSAIGGMLMAFGLFSVFLWTHVIIFDNWWRLRNIKSAIEEGKIFKYYCCYTFGFVAFLGLVLLLNELRWGFYREYREHIAYFLLVTLMGCSIVSFVLLILSGYYIYKMPKLTDVFENAKLSAEKDRFWIHLEYLALSFISFVLFEGVAPSWGDFWCLVITDIMQCFTTFLFLIIFVMNNRVKSLLFSRYGYLKDQASPSALIPESP